MTTILQQESEESKPGWIDREDEVAGHDSWADDGADEDVHEDENLLERGEPEAYEEDIPQDVSADDRNSEVLLVY